jgi:hypothetical protein
VEGGFNKDFFKNRDSSNDLATVATLPSDSSPFHEKYYMDEDGEILGEVSYSLDTLHAYSLKPSPHKPK